MNWLDSLSVNLLSKDLDGLWTRQRAIADNMANVSTPDYKAKTVRFEDQLQSVLADTSETPAELTDRIKNMRASVTVTDGQTSRADGNNVDVEQQNIEMARTQLNYMYSLRELSDYFARLKYAITDGKS